MRALVGVYKYPDEVPKDVYRRHRYCRCTVEYVPGNGKIHNVHTKSAFSGKTEKELEKFRQRQIYEINKNKEQEDKRTVDKMQRKLKSVLIDKEVGNVRIKDISLHVVQRAVMRNLEVNDIIGTIEKPLKITEIKYDANNRPSLI